MSTPFARPAMQRLQPATAAPCPGATGTRVAASQAAMQAKAQAQMQAQAPSAMEHAPWTPIRVDLALTPPIRSGRTCLRPFRPFPRPRPGGPRTSIDG